MRRIFAFLKSNIFLFGVLLFSAGILTVTIRINTFRYNHFDLGKFDLGNMTQMVWNTLHGRVLYLTDYFGTNLPRWSMSHVDPILLIFVPVFAIWQHPLTLVFSQLVLVIFSSVIVYKLAVLELESKFVGGLLAISYLCYPAIGFLTAWTGFHGVSVVIPFFFGAFYIFEWMHKKEKFTTKGLIVFWVLLVLTMMGKEQLPLYIFLYGIFVWLFREKKKLGISMMVVGFLWFAMAFFVIIPAFAHYRSEGYSRFAESLGLDTSTIRDVARPNYFLSRYEDFGDSYFEVAFNMATHPRKVVRVFFGGDKLDNFTRTLKPLGYLPFVYPIISFMAIPDFLINYLTTESGIGTAEITNHRISMMIPVLFISTIYAISWISRNVRIKNKGLIPAILALLVLCLNLYTSHVYNNPVYLWIHAAIKKRVVSRVAHAKVDTETANLTDLEVGDILKLSALENKDRECALAVVNMMPDEVSISGPDYLGAHLSMRETYAIFPALYREADYVIVDVFSRKILTILDADVSLVRDVVGDIVNDENYRLAMGCGNLFVFERVGPHGKEALLPLQEKFVYEERLDLEIFQSLTVVDYELPEELVRGEPSLAKFAYVRKDNNSLDGYFMFMTFVHNETGEIYQVANLPSFGIEQLRDWTEDHYYVEFLDLALPGHIAEGTYKAFVGMSNISRTRSMYLGELEVL